jgi:TonB family protein
MKPGLLLIETRRKRKPVGLRVPTLLVTTELWHRTFLGNLRDLLRLRSSPPPLRVVSRPGSFWPDVFVERPLPWGRFLQSGLGHAAVIAAIWGWAQLWPQRPQIVQRTVFHSSDVIYYAASEYLPPLNTGGERHSAKKGEPAYAPQPIISVPPESDNRKQTIVAPPPVKLDRDVPLPNVVAWAHTQPVIPIAVTARSVTDARLPVLPDSVVAPAPVVNAALSQREVSAPQTSVIAPPPQLENTATRRIGDLNIGAAPVIAPAPQLPVSEQRGLASMGTVGNSAAVPPPPSMTGSEGASGGRLIALNLHPVVPQGPVGAPAGNRRGTFAATPDGKRGGAGTPDSPSEPRETANGTGGGGRDPSGSGHTSKGVPPGLFVGAGSKPATASAAGNSPLLASVTPPRVTAAPRGAREMPENAASDLERKVFGGRKFYAMTLNVPNLNSAGGSWVLHFAELKENESQTELTAPVATHEVDPGYPLELMRENVQGTVTLSAVIRSDGSVGNVEVLRGVDDRLDVYARAALARWHFRPATRNGDAVALQAVVMIPFRPRKAGF